MQYFSTRGRAPAVDSAQAVLNGLAPDGGLYLPEEIAPFDVPGCLRDTPQGMAARILSHLLPDIGPMPELVRRAYGGKFQTEELTPTAEVGPYTVLELFRGPTCAFKDVALCMLPQLLTAAKSAKGEERDILILTATSGDTGKAALEGFRDVPGVRICVFYPQGGVSAIQRAQMVTQEGENETVCAVRGNFDDAQTGVKRIFAACRDRELPFRLSSANSINIGRLAPQVSYYFKAYRDLLDRGRIRPGDEVNFSVPTGNFGDILAGYLARLLGLPVGTLICASNANRVLTDFLETGVYDRRRTLLRTQSPSMDILVSSNLERLLWLMSGDTALVAGLMEQLGEQGFYRVPEGVMASIRQRFRGFCCTDAQGAEVIGRVWREQSYLMDPHTAAGWFGAEAYARETGDGRPTVVLSTASPYKFPDAVLSAVAPDAPQDADPFARMARLEALTKVPMPASLARLAGKPERHTRVLDTEQMLPFVLSL